MFQSLPHLRPWPNGSSATLARVMRCGRSTAPTRDFEIFPRVERGHLLAEPRPRVRRLHHQSVGESLLETPEQGMVGVRRRGTPRRSGCRTADAAAATGAARWSHRCCPGVSGVRPWNGLATTWLRNVSALLSRIALCDAVLLRHEVELLDERARAIPSGRDTRARPPSSRQTASRCRGCSASIRDWSDRSGMMPAAVADPMLAPRLVRNPRADPFGSQELAARHGIGQVRLERQAVVARHRHRRLTRIAKLIHGVAKPRHGVDLERRDEQSRAAADDRRWA